MDEEAQAAAARLVRRLKDGYTITIAESCTGGLLASTLTDIAGASKWFNQSWVTYSYDAKIRELNVDPKILEKRGAVSAEVETDGGDRDLRDPPAAPFRLHGVHAPASARSWREASLLWNKPLDRGVPERDRLLSAAKGKCC